MKSIAMSVSGSLIMISATVLIAFSCSKSKDSANINSAANYCGTISWRDTDQSGSFTGTTVNGTYRLTDATHTENGVKGEYQLHYDANGHLLNDLTGVSYVYTLDNLTKIVVTDTATSGNGTGEYDFDSNGHLTGGIMNFTSPGSEGQVTGVYTYDSNEDPVLFVASGTLNTSNGPAAINMSIKGDFLTDKTSMLPFLPIFAPASSYFSIIPFLSKHLINKWDVSITSTGIPLPINYTVQYTYTYDSNGNVATMVNTGNTSNIYSFTYSDCPQ